MTCIIENDMHDFSLNIVVSDIEIVSTGSKQYKSIKSRHQCSKVNICYIKKLLLLTYLPNMVSIDIDVAKVNIE